MTSLARSLEENSKQVELVRIVRIRFGQALTTHQLDWEEIAKSHRTEYDNGSYSPPRDRKGGYAGQAKKLPRSYRKR